MKQSFLPKQETLLTELRNWKNTENLCGNIYDNEAVKSRSFKKMKMQTYQGLYRKYKGAGISLSSDEKALHQMLRYQYKQIELKLYPNTLVRMGMRVWSAARMKVERLVKGGPNLGNQEMFNGAGLASVTAFGGREMSVESSVANSKEQKVDQMQSSAARWVNDLGRKGKDREKGQKMELH